jgi:hypothetical protein
MPAIPTVISLVLLQLGVDRRAIRSSRDGRRIAEFVRVDMLEILSQPLPEVTRNVMLLAEVGSELRAGDRKSKAALRSTADQEMLNWVCV